MKANNKTPAAQLRSIVSKERHAAMVEQVSSVPFVPAALVGRKFVKCDDPRQGNWLGAEWFIVLGDLGPMIVPARENASGQDYVFEAHVAIETESGLFDVSRYEFLSLTREFYKLVPKEGGGV